MPVDAATALADLDRLIESIGAVQTEDAAQTGQPRQKPIDFGQFEQVLDSENGPLSKDKPLIQKENSDFGQFGQRNSENRRTELDLNYFGNVGAPEEVGQYARASI